MSYGYAGSNPVSAIDPFGLYRKLLGSRLWRATSDSAIRAMLTSAPGQALSFIACGLAGYSTLIFAGALGWLCGGAVIYLFPKLGNRLDTSCHGFIGRHLWTWPYLTPDNWQAYMQFGCVRSDIQGKAAWFLYI